MINCKEKDGNVTFKVRVVPRSSRDEIVGEHDGALRVKLTAPPVEGAANAALVKILAREFGVASGAVEIVSGKSSKTKIVSIARRGIASVTDLLRNRAR